MGRLRVADQRPALRRRDRAGRAARGDGRDVGRGARRAGGVRRRLGGLRLRLLRRPRDPHRRLHLRSARPRRAGRDPRPRAGPARGARPDRRRRVPRWRRRRRPLDRRPDHRLRDPVRQGHERVQRRPGPLPRALRADRDHRPGRVDRRHRDGARRDRAHRGCGRRGDRRPGDRRMSVVGVLRRRRPGRRAPLRLARPGPAQPGLAGFIRRPAPAADRRRGARRPGAEEGAHPRRRATRNGPRRRPLRRGRPVSDRARGDQAAQHRNAQPPAPVRRGHPPGADPVRDLGRRARRRVRGRASSTLP